MEHKKSALIIGAGLGGLSLAAMLAKRGYAVTVIEKNESIGGRARLWQKDGYTFDMGPSWYMMPDVFEHYFSMMGEHIEEYLSLEKLSPSYRIFLKSDGTHHDFYGDIEKNKATFESFESGSGKVLEEFLATTKEQYEIAKHEFMYKNYDSIFDFFNKRVMKLGAKLPLFKKQKAIIEKLFKSEILRKVMQYQTVLLGTAPGDTPGIYSMMNYVDFGLGIWYPKGGIVSVPRALESIAKKYGVSVITNAPVEKIIVEGGRAQGVLLANGTEHRADIVVSNADIVHTDRVLLGGEYQQYSDRSWNKRTLAPSAFILYLGVSGTLPKARHHNLIFSEHWEESFSQIFGKTKSWPTDPSLYVCAPSKTDSTVAPEGCENLFVLVPIAPGLEYTEAFVKEYRDKVIAELATAFEAPDLASRIVVERSYCIKDFIADYNAFKGTALGLAHTLGQTAIFRPNNIHPKIPNLYFVGAGTNPGIGMPICLISAELAYKRIEGIADPFPLEKI
ncbi:MAG TPA: phytoene desaturase family protein [Candidatus Paceibacterota bacterium]